MRAGIEERTIGDLTVRIDTTLCVSFGDCMDVAPEGFRLDGDGTVEFARPERVDRDRLVRACGACPVDALSVVDEEGRQLVP
ncbi:MAG: ferredoxin [Gemmatimonadales bacterium]